MNAPYEPGKDLKKLDSARPLLVADTSAAEALALEAFGVWFDGELEKLVTRWIHLASPNAQRPARRGRTAY